MKLKSLFLVAFLTIIFACKEKDVRYIDKDEKITTAGFDKKVYDFGTIKSGELVKVIFVITNTGKEDLQITATAVTCGCTVANYPKKPIKPNKSEKIYVEFDSHGKKGYQSKDITIFANTKSGKENLRLKGIVKP